MKKSSKFSPEVRERVVRMVQEHRGEHPSMWAAIESIWAAAGSVDTDQSFSSRFKLCRAEVAQRRVSPRRVVEALDVVEHV